MLSGAYKKFAEANGLSVANGVAYGEYHGYMITLQDGMGTKNMVIAVSFPDETAKAAVDNRLLDGDFRKKNRIAVYNVTDSLILLQFTDTVGTMKVIEACAPEFCGYLKDLGVHGVGYCNHCGKELGGERGAELLIDGAVRVMHEGCAAEINASFEQVAEEVRTTGNVARGVLGASIGGVIGMIPWAIVTYFGWFVGWLGFLIGWLAKKGYEIAKGKETKAKGITILIVTLLAVVLAEYLTWTLIVGIGWIDMYPEAGMLGNLLDAFVQLPWLIGQNKELLVSIVTNVVLGWIFAILGILSVLKETFSQAKAATTLPKRLN